MSLDHSENNIAVIIKTTPARKSILWLLNSLELSLRDVPYKIYIADERPLDDWKEPLYNKLRDEGHFIKIWDEPVAVTIARNDLIDNLQDEGYVLRVDDDFELGGEFDIHALLTVLENEEIDFCCDIERQIGEGKNRPSGSIRIHSAHIQFKKDSPPVFKFKEDNDWKYDMRDGFRYAKADLMRNLILLKRYCFKKVEWNENLFFIREHEDFFLNLKASGLQGAFTPDSIHLHRDDLKRKILKDLSEKKERVDAICLPEYKRRWGGMPINTKGFFLDKKDYMKRKFRRLFQINS